MPKSYEVAIVNKTDYKKSYDKAVVSPAGNKFGDKLDPSYAKELAEDIPVKMLEGGTAGFADDALDLVSKGGGDSLRAAQKVAEERSPVASFVAETAGEQINPLLKAGSLRKNILATMAKVMGRSEDKFSKETAASMGVAGAVDLATDIAVKNMKIPFSNAPKTLRARVAGASTTEFKDIGINDRELIADKWNKKKFFGSKPSEWNMQTMSFEPVAAKKGVLQKPTSQILMDRTDDALDKLRDESTAILSSANKNGAVKIPEAEVIDKIESTLAEYQGNLVGDSQGKEKLESIAENLYDELFSVRKGTGVSESQILAGTPVPDAVMDVEKFYTFKRRLQDMSRAYGKNPQLKVVPVQDDFYRDLAYKMSMLLSDHVPDKRLRDIGMDQHDLLVMTKDLSNKIARQKATGLTNPPSLLQGRQGSFYAQKFLESLPMGSTDEGLLARAGAQELGSKIQEKAPGMVDFARQAAEGFPRELGQAFAPKRENGRAPQSVPSVSEHILKTKLPRTVEGILENKEVFLAKIAQQGGDNAYHYMKEVVNERPDELHDLLPMMIKTSPTYFERDPYNRIDNKVVDQESKYKAINDTMKREDLTTTEKISIIDNLNKTGEFLDYKGGTNADN